MAKKSFKGPNPALQFISKVDIEPYNTHNAQQTDNTPNVDIIQNTDNANYNQNTYNTDNASIAHDTHYAVPAQETQNTPDASYTQNTNNKQYAPYACDTHVVFKKETKSKRLNLLLQPSLLEDMSKVARMKQTSVNDLINKVLRDYTQSEVSTIARYDEVFGPQKSEMS